jgi:CRISPR/Cas system-associated exonuclease Cas4 (RecB family)
MSFGSAVHAASEFAIKYALEKGEYPSKELYIQSFKNKLSELPVSSYEQRFNLEGRGEKALDSFYQFLTNTPISWLHEVESKINFDLDGVKFYGVIDRIDKNEDGTYNIYDYKTGNAKNGKVICPDGEKEDYYNQMGLYKYFFELSTGNKVKQTTFIFPEEYTKNYTLEYSEDDCNAIVEKFKNAIAEIKNYNFEPSHNPEACKYCSCKDYCEMNVV